MIDDDDDQFNVGGVDPFSELASHMSFQRYESSAANNEASEMSHISTLIQPNNIDLTENGENQSSILSGITHKANPLL